MNSINRTVFKRFKTVRANAPRQTIQQTPILETSIEPLTGSEGFAVTRNPSSGLLPIYKQYKNGRTRSVTIIKKVQGDIHQMAQKLALMVPEERIVVKPEQQAIHLNGDYLAIVRKWLASK